MNPLKYKIPVSILKKVKPHQLAWLHRSELDKNYSGFEVWENPNGSLYIHDPKQGPLTLEVIKISIKKQERIKNV